MPIMQDQLLRCQGGRTRLLKSEFSAKFPIDGSILDLHLISSNCLKGVAVSFRNPKYAN